jgi:hypothetical protein
MSLLALACLSVVIAAPFSLGIGPGMMNVDLIVDLPIYAGTDFPMTVRVMNLGINASIQPSLQVLIVSLSFDWGSKVSYDAKGIPIEISSHQDFPFTVHVPEDVASDIEHTVTVQVSFSFSYQGKQQELAPTWEFRIPVNKDIPTTITHTHPTLRVTSMTGGTIVFPGTTPPGSRWENWVPVLAFLVVMCAVLFLTACRRGLASGLVLVFLIPTPQQAARTKQGVES